MVKFNKTKLLAYISLLVALNIVFARFLTIQTNIVKFDFGFVPIAVAGILFGPIVGAITGGLGDIFGMLIFSRGLPYFPLFTLNAIFYGLVFGLFLHKDKVSAKRFGFCIVVECLLINFFLTSIWLYLFNKLLMKNIVPYTIILTTRALLLLAVLPVHFFTMYFVKYVLCHRLKPFAYNSKRLVRYVKNNKTDINLGLDRVKYLLKEMGNPEKKLKFIHIAGTNGKGSVCAYLQSVLTISSYKTGKYISPYLIKQEECITIDNAEISDSEFEKRIYDMAKICEKYERIYKVAPTQFEITTAMAMKYFCDNNCDIVVLETGLGGIDDATNVVENTLIAVITKISLDHQEYLGNSIEEIASKKAGIIKSNALVVSCIQEYEVKNVLDSFAEKFGTKINYIAKSEVVYNPKTFDRLINKSNYNELSNSIEYDFNETFNYKHLTNTTSGIAGTAQIENASVAIECLLLLKDCYGFNNISDCNIINGIALTKNHARFEIINHSPIVIFDGAHNKDAMLKLNETLVENCENKKIGLVLGFMKDKDILGCLSALDESFNIYFAPIVNNDRAMDVDTLYKIAENIRFDTKKCSTLADALLLATKENDVTVVAGSLYQYKNAIETVENIVLSNSREHF